MTLRLTSADQARLLDAQQVLLTPADHEDAAVWAQAAADAVCRVAGADRAAVVLPLPDRIAQLGRDYGAREHRLYPELSRPLQQRARFLDRAVELGAWNRRRLWAHHLEHYHRSAYYNEFIVPNRMMDAVGLAYATSPCITVDSVAQIIVHTDRTRGAEYEERACALIGLLSPAFRSGVAAARMHAGARADLERLVDTMTDGLLLTGRGGRVLHCNPALRALLERDPAGDTVLAAAVRAAATSHENVCEPRTVTTPADRYTIAVVSRIGNAGSGVERIVRVSRGRRSMTRAEVRARYGLTPRQTDVALRMAAGRTTREIAAELSISPHTVKRHTEQVLLRLQVTSRWRVADVLTV